MRFVILNTLKRKGDKWEWMGKIIHNGQRIPFSGDVPMFRTDSQIKRAIKAKAKVRMEKYKKSLYAEQTKILSEDNTFTSAVG